jgi:GDP-L-fucose synthase
MNFWHNKRVLVTGGNGFLGKHVVTLLWQRGGLDVRVGRLQDYDLRYSGQVDEMFERMEPEVVINLAAAVGGISANISQPGRFFYDNVMMGMNLIEGARKYGVEKFVQMGSACEYPKYAPKPLKETDVWNGYPEETNAAYGIAKRALLTMGQAYRQQYGMNIIHLLSTNLYGPGDNFGEGSHVIAAMIKKFDDAVYNDQSHVELWGTGNATRDFLYVKDAAEGILLATEYYNDEASPVNLGSGRETSILEAAQKIAGLSGFKGKLLWDAEMPSGQPRRFLSTSLAKEKFGFDAKTSLEDGLEGTIKWYQEKSHLAR